MTDPLATDIAEKKEVPLTFEFAGEVWTVQRKPNMLLLSELARTDSGDPEALGVIAEFFEHTLGTEYKRFKKAFYASPEADDNEYVGALIGKIVEVSVGRPSE